MLVKVFVSSVVAIAVSAGGAAAVNANATTTSQASVSGYSKDQCKDSGWHALGYKNQGDCVSFFASDGGASAQ